MGWRLAEEVLDRLPPKVNSGARLYLCVLAQLANDDTREVIPRANLAAIIGRRTGLSANGQRSAVRHLVAAGLDPRIAMGADRNGDPLFAVPGRSLNFRIPNLPQGEPLSTPMGSEGEPGSTAAVLVSAPSTREGALTGSPHASTKYEGSSRGALTGSPSDAAILRERFGDAITAAEAGDVVAWFRRQRPDVRNLAGLFRSPGFTVTEALEAARTERRNRQASEKRRGPLCGVCSLEESACTARWPHNEHRFSPTDPIVTPRDELPSERAS